MKRIVREDILSIVDAGTGEVVETRTGRTYMERVDVEPYVMMFAPFSGVVGTLGRRAVSVAVWLALCSGYNTGIVDGGCAAIARQFGLSRATAWRCLAELRGAGFIVHAGGHWMINPSMCWRGDMTTRKKMMDNLKKYDL